MKSWFSFLLIFVCLAAESKQQTYVASTPAHLVVREFLRISLTDSIDFIRWKLEVDSGRFKLQCRYGLSAPSTPGFSNEKRVAIEGELTKTGNYYKLNHNGKYLLIFEVNSNVWHFADHTNQMLVGNGGYSYALNNVKPLEENEINTQKSQPTVKDFLVFEGRTPCKELSALLGLNKGESCYKMKWYFHLYADPLTGKPSHFLMGSPSYVKETMAKGTWKIVAEPNGRIVYQLASDKWTRSLNLLKVDENVLFFADADNRLLVGNGDFSYTLNKRNRE